MMHPLAIVINPFVAY